MKDHDELRQCVFASESESRSRICDTFGRDLGYAGRLLSIGLRATHALCEETASSCAGETKLTIGGMLAREIRRLRSIVMVSEVEYVENAEILTRCLFEGVLGERFILDTPIPLAECSESLRERRQRLPVIPPGISKEELHTHLYNASPALRMLAAHDNSDVDERDTQRLERAVSELQTTIGPEWMDVLRRPPYAYSGLNVRQLAENYRLSNYYESAYGVQSRTAHANDALQFVSCCHSPESGLCVSFHVSTKARYLQQLPLVLRLACGMFGTIVSDVVERFGLGPDTELKQLFAEYKEFVQES
jgi:hypothetical protein